MLAASEDGFVAVCKGPVNAAKYVVPADRTVGQNAEFFFVNRDFSAEGEIGGFGEAKSVFQAAREGAAFFIGGWKDVDATGESFGATASYSEVRSSTSVVSPPM